MLRPPGLAVRVCGSGTPHFPPRWRARLTGPLMSGTTDRKRKQPASPGSNCTQAKSRKQDSHLYTDDNPSTTLHGTGFQDEATARKTILLVKKRSLTYQFQVINTMFYRAKHHPHPNSRIEAAMAVFKEWLDEYPARKKQLPEYKKASRPLVQACLDALESQQIDAADDGLLMSECFQQAMTWARTYVAMPAGKRLANTLTSDDPEEPDMDSLRLLHLKQLVPEERSKVNGRAWRLDKDNHKAISDLHLQWILWGFTPAEKQAMTILKQLTQ